MRTTTFCLLMLFFGLAGSAQQIRIIDQDLFPIPDVHVLAGSYHIGVTDKEGMIDIQIPDSVSERTLTILHSGFHTKYVGWEEWMNDKQIILHRRTGMIGPVVVTSERVKRLRNDIAVQIERIGPDERRFFQAQTTGDLLSSSNKVYVQKSQMGGGSPMIRGFATNRILLVVDDVRMNTAIFRSGNLQNSLSIDPFSVEETELIFGPASQFYGSDAIGGVLNFKTKRIDLNEMDTTIYRGNALMRFSTANQEKTLHTDFYAAGSRWGSYTSLSLALFSDLMMGSNGPEEYLRPDYVIANISAGDTIVQNPSPRLQVGSGFSSLNLVQKIKYRLGAESHLDYGFYYSNIPSIPRYDRLIARGGNDSLSYAHWSYGPQVWMMNRLQLEHNSKNKWADQLKLTIAHQLFKESREDRRYNQVVMRDRREKVQAYSANLDFLKRLPDHSRLHYGVEGVNNQLTSTGILDGPFMQQGVVNIASRYPTASSWSSAGLYLNYFKRFNKWYKLEAGARYNYFAITGELDTSFFNFPFTSIDNSNNALTYSLAQLFQFNGYKLGIIGSTAYRSPNIDDVAKVFDSSPGTVIVPNPGLDAEYAYNVELSLRSPERYPIKLEAIAYHTLLTNAITRVQGQFNGQDSILYDGVLSQVERLDNTGEATVEGLQLNLIWDLDSHWTISSNYNWIQSSSASGEPIRHITPNYGGSKLSYKNKGVTAMLYLIYHDQFDADRFTLSERDDSYLYVLDETGQPYSPAWMTVNARVQAQISHSLDVNVGLENILDKRYRPYASGITAPGRNLSLSARFRF